MVKIIYLINIVFHHFPYRGSSKYYFYCIFFTFIYYTIKVVVRKMLLQLNVNTSKDLAEKLVREFV